MPWPKQFRYCTHSYCCGRRQDDCCSNPSITVQNVEPDFVIHIPDREENGSDTGHQIGECCPPHQLETLKVHHHKCIPPIETKCKKESSGMAFRGTVLDPVISRSPSINKRSCQTSECTNNPPPCHTSSMQTPIKESASIQESKQSPIHKPDIVSIDCDEKMKKTGKDPEVDNWIVL